MNDTPTTPSSETPGLDIGRLIADLLRAGETNLYRKVNLAVDRLVIQAVLRHVQGNQVEASKLLGISRTTLRDKMRALGLAVQKQVQPRG